MMHPRDRVWQALVDGELTPDREAAAVQHAATCARCTTRLAQVRELAGAFESAVAAIDATEPAGWAAPGAPATVTMIPQAASGRPRSGARWRFTAGAVLRRAALFVFATATVGAAALIVQRFVLDDPGDHAAVDAPAPRAATPAPASAVTVQPEDGAVAIAIEGAGRGSLLFVETVTAGAVTVQVEGEGVPRFRARAGSVDVILDGGMARVRVRVPATIRSAVVRVGGDVIARAADGRIDPPSAGAGVPIRQGTRP